MADMMMKIQQDNLALIFLIVNIFGSLNIEMQFFSRESTGVFSFSCRHTVRELYTDKNTLVPTVLHISKFVFTKNF